MCMQALVFLGLALGNLALLVHLSEKAIRLRKSWKDHRLLVNNHPEMESVDPERGLLAFKSDDLIRAFVLDNEDTSTSENQTIAGPRGTFTEFKVNASVELNVSDYLFDQIGVTETISTAKDPATSFKTISSNIRVTGVNTGYRIDIPVKFCKKIV